MRNWAIFLIFVVVSAWAENGAKYLIIAYDAYVPILEPLAQWKTLKGVPTKIVPVSQVGTTPSQIQAYIRDAYNNWPIRPEYVLLAGAPNQIPSYNSLTDCYYGDMRGDYKMEISVGRFFATNARECSLMVAKVLAYEKPEIATIDTLYFLKGTTIVREDNPPDLYYQADSRLVRAFWQDAGYVLCESLLSTQGHNTSHVNSAGGDGRMFITYRGQGVYDWWAPFNGVNPNSWNNGTKLPIVVSGSCAMIDLQQGNVQGDRFVRAGSPSALGGVIAYFGTSNSGSGISAQRSACFRGFFTALFREDEFRLGPATLRGRFWVDSLFHEQMRYQEWNLLGDPELCVWTGVPRMVTVLYDSVVPMVPQEFTVTVLDNGIPVNNAQVCLSMDSTVYVVGNTDFNGEVRLRINPRNIGFINVVVTGRNILPFDGRSRVIVVGAPYLVVFGRTIDDYLGNRDGVPNPGERLRLFLSLKNVGAVSAAGVYGILRLTSSHAIVFDSIASYGTVEPESIRMGDAYELWIDSCLGDGAIISGQVLIYDANGDSWNQEVNLVVRAGKIRFHSAVFFDSPPGGNGNGQLGRLESGRLAVAVRNEGGGGLSQVVGILSCDDSNIVVVDSLSFYGQVDAGVVNTGMQDRFGVAVGPALQKNQVVRFQIKVLGRAGTYSYCDTFSWTVMSETGGPDEPTGPDRYGYWCYDDTDTASGRAPVYDWFELAPPGPGEVIPVVSDSDAATITMRLPFSFCFYGRTDTLISICSNGFLTLGYANYRWGRNYPIPDTAGPPRMLAPFWDDLNPNETNNGYGTAYQFYDTVTHRWICEFKDFAHYNQPNIREGFQVVLYDPNYYQTPTGDGEIVFLYQRVSLNSGCTVGIEDQTETVGVQYLYNNSYPPSAAYLQPGRAIKFTTWPPRGTLSPWLLVSGFYAEDTLGGNGNGLFEPGERVGITVFLQNRGNYEAANTMAIMRSIDGDAVVYDSIAHFGLLQPGDTVSNLTTPFRVEINSNPADSILDFMLMIQAENYVTTAYFSLGISGLTGLARGNGSVLITRIEEIKPNPFRWITYISYELAQPTMIDLAVFDVLGRRVTTLAYGFKLAGRYQVPFSTAGLAQGVYFCRLLVQGNNEERRFTKKLQIVR